MKAVLIKIQILSLLMALPALANDVGLHSRSAQPTRAVTAEEVTPIVIAQAVKQQKGQQKFDYLINSCKEIASSDLLSGSDEKVFGEIGEVQDGHLQSLIEPPKHGKMLQDSQGNWEYIPISDYRGTDRAIFSLETDGKRYKVILTLIVTPTGEAGDGLSLCPASRTRRLG